MAINISYLALITAIATMLSCIGQERVGLIRRYLRIRPNTLVYMLMLNILSITMNSSIRR